MDVFTPSALIELYSYLSNDDKAAFRRLLGVRLAMEDILQLLADMPKAEINRFAAKITDNYISVATPKLILECVRKAKQFPDKSEEELIKIVESSSLDFFRDMKSLAESQVKEARDPKPRNTERDNEIVRLKNEVLPNGEQRTFGQVVQLMNAKWPKLSRSAAIRAYNRSKNVKK